MEIICGQRSFHFIHVKFVFVIESLHGLYEKSAQFYDDFDITWLVFPVVYLLPVITFGIKQESVEATAEVSKTFNDKIRKYCDITLLSCAYAGTGNVLKVEYYIESLEQKLIFLAI